MSEAQSKQGFQEFMYEDDIKSERIPRRNGCKQINYFFTIK